MIHNIASIDFVYSYVDNINGSKLFMKLKKNNIILLILFCAIGCTYDIKKITTNRLKLK